MNATTIFSARLDAPPSQGVVAARDGRSAAWMAAAWSVVTGRTGHVAVSDADDKALAHLVAARARVTLSIGSPERTAGEADDAHACLIADARSPAAPVDEWRAIDARPIRLERLAADLTRVLPPGAVVCVEVADLEPVVLAAAAAHPSVLALSRLSGLPRGAAIAWAIGAKAAAPSRTVVALTDAPGFAIGGMDLATAARHDLPVAVVVANAEHDLPAFELVAPIAGGHGEQVTDPSRLAIHLRNAMSVPISSVINVAVEAPRTAPRRHPVARGSRLMA